MCRIKLIFKNITKQRVRVFFAKCVFYYFKAVGLAPIKLEVTPGVGNKSCNWKLKNSKIGTLYNVFLIIAYITLQFYGISFAYRDNYRKEYGSEIVLFAISDSIIAAGVAIVLVIFFVEQKTIITLVDQIYDTRKVLKVESKIGKLNFDVVAGTASVIIFIVISMLPFDYGIHTSIYNFACNSSVVISYFLVLQYALILRILRNSFYHIHKSFKKISGFIVLSRETLSDRSLQLMKIMQSYDSLIVICEDVSKFYSLPMLLAILISFIDSIICSYSLTKHAVIQNSALKKFDLIDSCIIGMIFISMLTLVINVNKTVEEVMNYTID